MHFSLSEHYGKSVDFRGVFTLIFKGKSVVFLEKPLRVDSGLRAPRALLLSANPFTPGPAGAGEQENVAIRGQAGVRGGGGVV